MRTKTRAAQAKADDDDLDLPDHTRSKQADQEVEVEEEAEDENNNAPEEPEPEEEEEDDDDGDSGDAHAGQKRKSPPTSASESQPKKAARQASGSTSVSPKKLLNFLLSAKALPYCFPEEELEAAKSSSTYKSYSLSSPSSFTPFEHLVCAHLLSKQLSHVLGLRSIRTLLNDLFNFTTPESITSADIFALAEEANDSGSSGVIEHIKSTVPGLAVVGGETLCRRVQCVDGWGDALWPYADGKALDSLRQIGIYFEDAEEVQSVIEREVDWDQVKDTGLPQRELNKQRLVGDPEETQMQAEFVVLLERAIGRVLEGNVNDLKEAAAVEAYKSSIVQQLNLCDQKVIEQSIRVCTSTHGQG